MRSLAFLISLFFASSILGQAGRLDKSAVRLKMQGMSGSYHSDWEKRNQDFNLVYRRVWEENWQNQNKAFGGKAGIDYYASLRDDTFTHLLFGLNFSSINGQFPFKRFNESQAESGKYKGDLQQIELTFGTVIAVTDEFRVIPKFVHRTINQTLKNSNTILINDITDFGYLTSNETMRSTSVSGYLGVGMEYDLTPKFSIYFDSLLFSNFLIHQTGQYAMSSKLEGIVQAQGNSGILNRSDASEGAYKMSGRRFLIGGSLKVSESLRVFFSTERDTLYSEINSPLGTNALLLLLLSSRSLRFSSDTLNKTITENIVYSNKQKLETTMFQIGISKDFDI